MKKKKKERNIALEKTEKKKIHFSIKCKKQNGRENLSMRTAYFFRLEKKRATDCYIWALRASDGCLVMDKDGLCNLLGSFYLDLFTIVPCDSSARAELRRHISLVLLFHDRVRHARVFSVRGIALRLCRVWFVGGPLAAILTFPWNFILKFPMYWATFWFWFQIMLFFRVRPLAFSAGVTG